MKDQERVVSADIGIGSMRFPSVKLNDEIDRVRSEQIALSEDMIDGLVELKGRYSLMKHSEARVRALNSINNAIAWLRVNIQDWNNS